MKCLLILKKNEEDEEGDPLRTSASRSLEVFVKVCDVSVVEAVTRSVSNILQSSEPYQQQASVILFSTICEFPDVPYIQEVFRNGFDHLFGLLQCQNKIVVRNSLIGFVRLAEMLPEVFLTHKNIGEIVDTIMDFVRVPNMDIRLDAISILTHMTEGLK